MNEEPEQPFKGPERRQRPRIEPGKKAYTGPERRQPGGQPYSGPERRRARRIKGAVVEYLVEGQAPPLRTAFLRDLSIDGLSLFGTESFIKGQRLQIIIYLYGFEQPAEVTAEVCWVRPSKVFKDSHIPHFDVGLKIVSISDAAKSRLNQYLSEHADES